MSGAAETSGCGVVRDELVDLALEQLGGERRADALAHLESCAACSAELAQLMAVSDALLELAPVAEPPLGFEDRVLRAVKAAAPQRRAARRRRAYLLAGAAAVVIASAVAVGLQIAGTAPTPPGQSATLTSLTLLEHGSPVGTAFLAPGTPSWVFMQIDQDLGDTRVRCEVVLADGAHVAVGTFWLRSGYGLWGARLSVGASSVRSVRVLTMDGALLASARVRE